MKPTILLNVLALTALTLTACSEDKYEGEVPTNFYIQPGEECGYSTYYTPFKGRIGDPMPFYDENVGEFKILYLQEYDNNLERRFHPIWTVATEDCANYRNLGETLPVGEYDWQQDAALGTGCCYYNKKEKLYYLYYTGENALCNNRQVVMRATSSDFMTWTKDKSWALFGDDYGLSKEDFRDPQIFEDEGIYHMIISTRPNGGGDPRFAEFVSTDMKDWKFQESFNMLFNRMYECPDVFQMGNYWYIVFSDAMGDEDWGRKVKYIMADSWANLKAKFANAGVIDREQQTQVLDARAFYAGKTASNGTDRYIWGWCPFRSGKTIHEKNVNIGMKEPNWSGALVCHKLIQHEDGTLSVGKVPAIEAKYNTPVTISEVEKGEDYTLYSPLGKCNHISFTATASKDTEFFGISFARPDTMYYSLVVSPQDWAQNRVRVSFEQNGEKGKGFIVRAEGNLFPHPTDNVYNVDVFTDNSVVTIYVNNYGYTQRIYGIEGKNWSINTYGGKVTIKDVKVSQYVDPEIANR